ncbi:PREDICTED: polycystic kidney disease 2-like 2 protein [Ceratotherium simum simum]|uniref:Polycystic kidney disease 2-like 2 protein n=1 Tax=Ceratotherium simum simum TaxID=73337 RepID=A0ABM1DHK1_CERSS|nr:PREDICTED: polycystic kidney disease 2-like 2 protein [Ceratotherium simum simum]
MTACLPHGNMLVIIPPSSNENKKITRSLWTFPSHSVTANWLCLSIDIYVRYKLHIVKENFVLYLTGTPKHPLHYRKEVEIRTTLQELLLYFIFLINLCILTFGMVNPHMYYLNKVMSSLFLDTSVPGDERTNFKSIRSITDFWKFMEGPLLEGLYWDSWYNNQKLYNLKNSNRIYYENILLGVPQVRQLKVRNNTCKIYSSFQSLMSECYDKYTSANEDLSEFGLKDDTEWKYSTPSVNSPWHWGFVGVYRNGGYIFTLSKSKSEIKDKFVNLRLNSWITRGTRVIFIDFSLYNANVNLFCIIRLVAEFPATGGILTSWQFYSVKLLRYVSYYDYFIASCEIIFCIFLIVFTIQEIKNMKEFKWAYFKSIWNWLELLLLVLCFVAVFFNSYCNIQVFLLLGQLLKNTKKYSDFYFLAYWHIYYNNILAITIFFAWIKIFKFISFNKTMSQLSSTLSRCIKDIVGFAIMFFIIFFAYAQLGFLVFGSQVDDFSTFHNSIFAQFRIILGDFNFAGIQQANRILGPIYFITFIFFVFFVLLNMFLAIINDTYSEVKADYSLGRRPDFELCKMIKESYNNALEKLNLKKPQKDENKNNMKSGDLAERARREGFDENEIQSAERMKKWKERLEKKYYSTETQDDYQPVTQQEFRELFLYAVELEKELHYVSLKLNRVMRKVSALRY